MCERHHHLVHEGGWTLQLFPDRRTIWRTPSGTVYHDGITTDRLGAARTTAGPEAAVDVPPGQPARRCRTERPESRPDTVARVAAELRQALADIAGRAPP